MANWTKIELRPLFDLLLKKAENDWKPEDVLKKTKKTGYLILGQLKQYTDGKYRADRNEAKGFFESIDRFAETGLPISLEHFTDLVNQYKDRITPYPHYSGIKVVIPENLDDINEIDKDQVPDLDDLDDEEEEGSSVQLM